MTTAKHLREIPALAWWLPRALVARTSTDAPTRSVPDSRLPFRADILDLLDHRLRLDRMPIEAAWADPDQTGVLPYLHTWERDIAAELIDAGHPEPWRPARPTIRTTCLWLRRHLDFAATLPQWPDFAWGIGVVHSRVEVATRPVREDAPRHLVTHGECDDQRNKGHLHPLSSSEWRCDKCDRYIKIRAVTLPEAARIANFHVRTLQRWAKAGEFTSVEYQGVKYYDLGQILGRVAEERLTELLVG